MRIDRAERFIFRIVIVPGGGELPGVRTGIVVMVRNRAERFIFSGVVVSLECVPVIEIVLPLFCGNGDPGQGGGVRVLDRKILVQGVPRLKTIRFELVVARHHADRDQRFMLRGIQPDPIQIPVAVRGGQDLAVNNRVRVFIVDPGVVDCGVHLDLIRRRHRLGAARRDGGIEAGDVGENHPVDCDGQPLFQRTNEQRPPGVGDNAIWHRVLLLP